MAFGSNVPGSSQAIGSTQPQHVMGVLSDWVAGHSPAVSTQATATRAAAGAGIRNVCTGVTITFCATSTAPTATQLNVALIDGPSGGANYLWGPIPISLPAVAGAMTGITRVGMWRMGTANTAMTLEFSGAGGANTIQAVDMEGTTIGA